MKHLLLLLFGRKPTQKFRELKFVKKEYPIREFNQTEFEKWCNEYNVGVLWDRRIIHLEPI